MRNGLALDLDRSVSVYPSLDAIPDPYLPRNPELVGQPSPYHRRSRFIEYRFPNPQ